MTKMQRAGLGVLLTVLAMRAIAELKMAPVALGGVIVMFSLGMLAFVFEERPDVDEEENEE